MCAMRAAGVWEWSCIGYAAPAGAIEKGKMVEVPASTARA
jgi:hypothetical protein